MSKLSHINNKGNPKMVTISDKRITKRTAIAKATMFLGKELISHFKNDELITKKGPVFQTCNHCRNSGCKKNLGINSYVSSLINKWS
jgi:cyclic pyranopterin phosphate synthase